VRTQLWTEIHRAVARSRFGFGDVKATELKLRGDHNFALGLSTNRAENFQGHHARQVLIIADEAPGIESGIWDAIAGTMAGGLVHVVMAAPKDSLAPYTWWFPIVGSVPYRGYFDDAEANAEAAEFEAAGYDTLVRPAVAFSSLGFFNDPLLSNLLKLDRVQLAGVIIHELFHRTFFLASDVMFDESAATFVGGRGAIEFFAATEGHDSPDAEQARGIVASDLLFADFLQLQEARLLELYGSDLPRDEIVRRREPLLKQIQADYARLKPRLSGLERFDLDQQPLNNAVLINYRIYFHDLDNFAALDRQYAGDLTATVQAIIALASAHPEDPFFAIWQATHEHAGETSARSERRERRPITRPGAFRSAPG
jgi:predicted aminopeptidase